MTTLLEDLYQSALSDHTGNIYEHLPYLRSLAAQCATVTEFGVHDAVSTTALLAAQPKSLISYDVLDSPRAQDLKAVSGMVDFQFRVGSSRDIDIAPTELLFIDTFHTSDQLYAELARHHSKVSRWIAMHDTVTFGEVGEGGAPGILHGLRRFLRERREWRIIEDRKNCNGLIVMERTPTISLFVDVWGTYFRQILSEGWIAQMAANCGGGFDDVAIIENNIPGDLRQEYFSLLTARFKDRSLDRVFSCGDHADVLSDLHLSVVDLQPRLYESLGDYVAIAQCHTEYMAYFAGDALPWGRSNWVREGIDLMEKNPDFLIVNPTWNGQYEHARSQNFEEREAHFLGQGFSDQCYLARTADLRADIYRETNAESDRIYHGPHGNTFEKRVDAYMRNHGKYRVTLKTAAYITRP